MASMHRIISIAIFSFFFLLLNLVGPEATSTNPPPTQSSSQCAKDYIEEHMQITADQTKEFLKKELGKRLRNLSTGEAERKCLMMCYQAYENSGESMAAAANNFAQGKYTEATQEVVKYLGDIAPCLQCSTQNLSQDAEFMHFQKLAKTSGEDLIIKLKSCH